jgi:AraC family transcriptional regulator
MAFPSPTLHGHREFKLAGIRRWHDFATAFQTIPPQWNEFNALSLPLRNETQVTYGATCQMDMPNQRFEYLSGYEVEDFANLPADIGRMIVPRQHYAVFPLDTVADIRPFWQQVFQTWLPTSGYKPAHTPDFERYDERFNPVTRGPLEIWFPIESSTGVI